MFCSLLAYVYDCFWICIKRNKNIYVVRNNVENMDDTVFLSDHQLRNLFRMPGHWHHRRPEGHRVKLISFCCVPKYHGVVVTTANNLQREIFTVIVQLNVSVLSRITDQDNFKITHSFQRSVETVEAKIVWRFLNSSRVHFTRLDKIISWHYYFALKMLLTSFATRRWKITNHLTTFTIADYKYLMQLEGRV